MTASVRTRRKRPKTETARTRATRACARHLKDLKRAHGSPPKDVPVRKTSTPRLISPVPTAPIALHRPSFARSSQNGQQDQARRQEAARPRRCRPGKARCDARAARPGEGGRQTPTRDIDRLRRILDPFDTMRANRVLAPHDPKLNDIRWLIGKSLRRTHQRAQLDALRAIAPDRLARRGSVRARVCRSRKPPFMPATSCARRKTGRVPPLGRS